MCHLVHFPLIGAFSPSAGCVVVVLEVVDADLGDAPRPVGVLGEVGLVLNVSVVDAGDGEERRLPRLVRPVLRHHRGVLALQLDGLACG